MVRGEHQPVRLDVTPASVKLGRQYVSDLMTEHGLDDKADDVVLATSELLTNAVKHATDRIELALNIDPSALRLEVADDCDDHPIRQYPGPNSLYGRGLHIVDTVAHEWGCQPIDSGGKIVWARFNLPS